MTPPQTLQNLKISAKELGKTTLNNPKQLHTRWR